MPLRLPRICCALQSFHEILMSFPYSVQQEDLTEWIHQYAVLPFFLVFLQLFLVFPSIPPSSLRELLVFLVSLKSFCFFRCTPAFLEALLISMVFLMRAPDFSPVPPDKHEAFLVLIPCVRCLHSCSILPVI